MKPRGSLWLLALCSAVLSCEEESTLDAPQDPHPELPILMRDVAMIDDEVRWVHPFVPGFRTTMDGRVAVRVQGGPPGTESLRQNLSFYLLAPEKLEAPILAGPSGPAILASTEPFDVPFPPALDPETTRLGHHAICDPTLPFPVEGERPNPTACGPGDAHDCYDFTIISSTSAGVTMQMWGTPVRVEVAWPKTARARIFDVTLGEPVAGVVIPGAVEFMEPAVTEDGRLLTGRLGRFGRDWTNPETGATLTRNYDVVYFQLPDEAEPCDVTAFTTWHPMAHAPFDPRMVGRYGLAAYPFRDTEGNPIPDGEDLGGTYPWVDREGANVFMTGVHGTIAEQSEARFPRRCVAPGCESLMENVDWDRGFMIGGLWTHGKFVLLDGLINNQDWAVGVTPASHWWVDLYKTTAGEPVPVRFGSGRFIDSVREAGGPYPAGYTHNANILDSVQHLFNHRRQAAPVTPRDVVWLMGTGVATDEIAFDDFLDRHALIVSNMQASITQIIRDDGRSTGIPKHHNGQVRTLMNDQILLLPELVLDPDADEDIHLQNAATTLEWQVPAYGLIRAGTARIEPVALGGVEGRGLWLSGEAEVVYSIPEQERPVAAAPLYVGLFVDPRAARPAYQGLFRFPDGSGARLRGRTLLEILAPSGVVAHQVELAPSQGWRHLGFTVDRFERTVTILVDGMPVDRFVSDEALFVPHAGDLVLAPASPERLRGWVDDFKVILYDVGPEVACNHARGTLVRLDGAAPVWVERSWRTPDVFHEEIARLTDDFPSERYVCFCDHRADRAAHLGNLPAGTSSVRERILFPEGPLRTGAPRPDSTQNSFCLSCHGEQGRGAMSLAALELRPDVLAEHDPRRQPDQPPRRVFGNVPPGWIPPGRGPGSPPEHLVAPPEGLVIDPWVLPVAE